MLLNQNNYAMYFVALAHAPTINENTASFIRFEALSWSLCSFPAINMSMTTIAAAAPTATNQMTSRT